MSRAKELNELINESGINEAIENMRTGLDNFKGSAKVKDSLYIIHLEIKKVKNVFTELQNELHDLIEKFDKSEVL